MRRCSKSVCSIAAKQLSKVVEGASKGASFIIAKPGKPVVKVTVLSAPAGAQVRRLGFMAGQISVPDDLIKWVERRLSGSLVATNETLARYAPSFRAAGAPDRLSWDDRSLIDDSEHAVQCGQFVGSSDQAGGSAGMISRWTAGYYVAACSTMATGCRLSPISLSPSSLPTLPFGRLSHRRPWRVSRCCCFALAGLGQLPLRHRHHLRFAIRTMPWAASPSVKVRGRGRKVRC